MSASGQGVSVVHRRENVLTDAEGCEQEGPWAQATSSTASAQPSSTSACQHSSCHSHREWEERAEETRVQQVPGVRASAASAAPPDAAKLGALQQLPCSFPTASGGKPWRSGPRLSQSPVCPDAAAVRPATVCCCGPGVAVAPHGLASAICAAWAYAACHINDRSIMYCWLSSLRT